MPGDDNEMYCAVSKDQLEELPSAIQKQIYVAVRKAQMDALGEYRNALAESGSMCPANLPGEVACEVTHFFGMLKDVGNGDIYNGVENFRAIADAFKTAGANDVRKGAEIFEGTVKLLGKLEKIGGKIVMVAVVTLVAAFATGMGVVLWNAFKAAVTGTHPGK